ncbi:TetR/AcrR family transcriptional regulator [Gandjariella thermophila]|nr:TetR/AcrR family transcriptional regulator [Gandjariella thermophila]
MSEPIRQVVEGRRADTVRRLLDATVAELREVGFPALTVRSVARRAQVSPATAYTYFSSKEHLVTAVFWKKVQALPPAERDRAGRPAEDVAAVVRAIALLLVDEPELAQACTLAMLTDHEEVRRLRDQIGREIYARLADALGADADPPAERAVLTAFVGAMVLAGSGHLPFAEVADHLREITETVLRRSPVKRR